MFSKKVRKNSRKEMIDFLKNHFRYSTLNTWNQSTSYANNVKIYNLDLTPEQSKKAYEIVRDEYLCTELYDRIEWLWDEFFAETGYVVGMNGRNNGYMVIYETLDNGIVYPGRSIDMYEDFEDWRLDDIKERVKLVQRFDKLCDDCVAELIDLIENYDIVEVSKKIMKTLTYNKFIPKEKQL